MRGVVLVDRDLLGRAQVLELDVLELDAEVLGDGLAAGEDGDVLQHGLAAVAVARRLHRGHVQRPAQLVHDQRRQGVALQVLGHDQQRLGELRDLLQDAGAGPSCSRSSSRGSARARSRARTSIRSGSVTKYGER